MAAQNKEELLKVLDKEFAKLTKLLGQILEQAALEKDAEDTSLKDIVAHRAHWIDLFLGWHADGQAGKTVYFPAKGYKWNALKQYNADLRTMQRDLTWSQALDFLNQRHQTLRQYLQELSEQALYAAPMKGAKNHWTTGRWAEAAGPSHYRSAAKYIRADLKNRNSPSA